MQRLPTYRIHQLIGAIGAGLGTLFWGYTFHYIAGVAELDQSGFKWLAEVPLTGVWLFLCVPAFLLSSSRQAAPISSGLSAAAIAAFGYLWPQLLAELGVR